MTVLEVVLVCIAGFVGFTSTLVLLLALGAYSVRKHREEHAERIEFQRSLEEVGWR